MHSSVLHLHVYHSTIMLIRYYIISFYIQLQWMQSSISMQFNVIGIYR